MDLKISATNYLEKLKVTSVALDKLASLQRQKIADGKNLCPTEMNVTSTTRVYFPHFSLFKKTLQSYYLSGCSTESELEAKIYDVLMTSYVLLEYFKVPNGPAKVTLQTIRSICSAKWTAP